MRQYKEQLTGTGMVYRFTLQQFLKNKANLISLIMMAVFAMAAVPVSSLISGNAKQASHAKIANVYFSDMSEPYSLSYTDLQNAADEDEYWTNTTFLAAPAQDDADGVFVPAGDDAYAEISFNPETASFEISVRAGKDTALDDSDLAALGSFLSTQFDQARYRTLNISEAQLAFVMSGWNSDTATLNSYLEGADKWETQYLLQMIYSIVLMMVSIMSVSYIIRAVIEEKASKLIELLMVSVKPLALIVGKILAAMTYVLLTLAAMVAGYFISYTVCSRFMQVSSAMSMLSSTPIGFSSDLLHINGLAIAAAVISLVLAYLTFAIVAGVSAAGCSSTEDTQGATTGVTFLILAGYMISMFVSTGSTPTLSVITSLVPVVSVFSAPVHFMMGNIGVGILILSWVLQAVVVVLLSVFCAKIYSSLLMHRGNRIGFKQMFSMAGITKAPKKGKEVH